MEDDAHEEGEIIEESFNKGEGQTATPMEEMEENTEQKNNTEGEANGELVNSVHKGSKRSHSSDEDKHRSRKKAKKEDDGHRHRHHHKSDKKRHDRKDDRKDRKRERDSDRSKEESAKRRKSSEDTKSNGHENGDVKADKDREREPSRQRDRERRENRERSKTRGDSKEREHSKQRESDRDRERRLKESRDRNSNRREEEQEKRKRDRENWEKERDRREKERLERHRLARGEAPLRAPVEEDAPLVEEEKKKTPEELKREEEEYQRKVALALKKQQEETDLDKLQEERRRRREAIMAKYKKDQEAKKEEPIKEEVKPEVKETVQEEKKEFVPTVSNGSQESQTVKVEAEAKPEEPLMKKPLDYEPDKFATISDMFSEAPVLTVEQQLAVADGGANNQHLDDNWDDEEGYYCLRVSEILNGKYRVFAGHGKGVFSTVLRARVLKKAGEETEDAEEEEVAIKVIRNNETMYKAGLKERDMLKMITNADPHDKKHCVRLINSFMHRNHLCLVLEPMQMDMREVIRKYGRDIGITIHAVKIYAKQLFETR